MNDCPFPFVVHKKASELPGLAVNGCDEAVGLRVVEGVLRVVVGQGFVRPGGDVADVCILGAEAAVRDGTRCLHVPPLHAIHEIVGMVQMVVVRRLHQLCLYPIAL